jgi:hypothetical protein
VAPANEVPLDGSIHAHLRSLITLLDEMLGDPGLALLRRRHPRHPAVLRREALEAVGDRPTLPVPEMLSLMTEFALMSFDYDSWLPPPEARTREFWDFLGDTAAARHIRSGLTLPRQFDETLSEVRVWGQLSRRAGLDARLVEETGLPDVRIGTAPDDAWAEVKFAHSGTPPSGLRRPLRSAERQLAAANARQSSTLYLFLERTLTYTLPLASGTDGRGRWCD